ncbi:MAG: lasso peptide biosynthesis B2 protein [Pleurocapsa sp.]
MNTVLNAIASSNKIYRLGVLFPQLLSKAIAKPQYILLCVWAFKQLWWVDSCLKEMALAALKVPADLQPASLSQEQKTQIRQRAVAIAWTAKIHPVRPKCLHRSLVLHQWLQEQGINAQLEIGWGEDIGHAWVTYNGKVLNDRADIASITPRLT